MAWTGGPPEIPVQVDAVGLGFTFESPGPAHVQASSHVSQANPEASEPRACPAGSRPMSGGPSLRLAPVSLPPCWPESGEAPSYLRRLTWRSGVCSWRPKSQDGLRP